jgi:hypothetical protein
MIKNIVIFCTKVVPGYFDKIFRRHQSNEMNKLDKTEDEIQETKPIGWIEDFDERERY